MFVPLGVSGPQASQDSLYRVSKQTDAEELHADTAKQVSASSVLKQLHNRRPHRHTDDAKSDEKSDASSDGTLTPPSDRNLDFSHPPAPPPPQQQKQMRPTPTQSFFTPRVSILDYTELMYQGSDRIRGLVTCFWTIVGAYLVSLLVSHYEASGEVMARGLGSLIFSRATELILSDMLLVASTVFVVPFVRLLWTSGLVDPRLRRSAGLQAAAEVAWLAAWYLWQGTRGWPWSQRCFFALHTMVNWMKVHSYLSTNRHLAGLFCTRNALEKEAGSKENQTGLKADEAIAALDAELCPYGDLRFPQNLTLGNYAMFQLCPALVYEIEYPRTESIRWGYVAEKLLGTAGIFVVFYIVVAHLMIPHLERMAHVGILSTTVHLMGPMATCWLLFFFITFDCIANGFAELTRFADRRFYDDWWNARGLDEFSRKWNRPVHMFLARHIYMPVRQNWKPGSAAAALSSVRRAVPASVAAMAVTFFFSSVLHEVTIVVACMRWNHGVFFFSQMMQIPLIMFSDKVPWFRDQQALRNWSFWLAMVFFQPLLLCLYTYKSFAKSV
ncbi:Sterol O-acyltransferase 2 (Sterol-ester synthase 2) [Coemansia sp. Benny D115]|nr:Sterol O-acyltransferase 2 (Sterol-ester synthase 2) [Coemansia sp. Benny D115]